MSNKVASSDEVEYQIDNPLEEDALISKALAILSARLRQPAPQSFSSPRDVGAYCCIKAADNDREVFSVLCLDAQNGLIDHTELFFGTLTQSSVYPREVVKLALQKNAAAVILTHNHPSGCVKPSRADEALTKTLKAALALVDVRVLDHIITSGGKWLSMAEQGIVCNFSKIV